MDCPILHTVLLVIILLFIIAIICYDYGKHIAVLPIQKLENNDLKKLSIKNCTCFHFDDIIKSEDFDSDNILLDEKLYDNILVYDISHKTLIGSKPLRIRFDKIDGLIRVYDGTRYLVLFGGE